MPRRIHDEWRRVAQFGAIGLVIALSSPSVEANDSYPVHKVIDFNNGQSLIQIAHNICNFSYDSNQRVKIKENVELFKKNYRGGEITLFDINQNIVCDGPNIRNFSDKSTPVMSAILFGRIANLKRYFLKDASIRANINSPINSLDWTWIDWINSRLKLYQSPENTNPGRLEVIGYLEVVKKEIAKLGGKCSKVCQ